MSSMFSDGSFNGDLSKWDVSKGTDMSLMFSDASSFNGDLSKWDVSKATDMSFMFERSSFNGDLSRWDVSKVTDKTLISWGAPCSLCDHLPHSLKTFVRQRCQKYCSNDLARTLPMVLI